MGDGDDDYDGLDRIFSSETDHGGHPTVGPEFLPDFRQFRETDYGGHLAFVSVLALVWAVCGLLLFLRRART